ncbi:MAG: DNRLRE domain-containing protein [Bacteroidia bacterium]
MKRTITPLVALCLMASTSFAQTTIVLQPGPADGKDAEIFSCVSCGYAGNNYGTKRDLNAIAWTKNGNNSNVRSLIQFDLSGIPANAFINSATLSLYFNPTSEEGKHYCFPHSNSSYLERITSNWNETTVTWNNQPTTTSQNRVSLGGTTSSTQSFTNINVKQLIIDSRNNPATSFGFMLRLQQEHKFKKLIFASSDNTTEAIRPKLTITYTVPAPINGGHPMARLDGGQTITSLNIFPNPVSEIATIQLPDEAGNGVAKVEVFNILGKLCNGMETNVNADRIVKFDVSDLQQGVYVVKVFCNEKVYAQRIVVE